MIFFTSDTHFNHSNILKYCPRRSEAFADIAQHDEYIISDWNSKITDDDTVFHLGDFALGAIPDSYSILDRLNGEKVLITGNHDRRHIKQPDFRNRFAAIKFGYHEVELKYNGQKVMICLCHYPMQSWNKWHYGSFHLHGHVHGNPVKIRFNNMMDVGIDTHPSLGIWGKDEALDFASKY
jgi:calcineurin-like phosphoesterase family protein